MRTKDIIDTFETMDVCIPEWECGVGGDAGECHCGTCDDGDPCNGEESCDDGFCIDGTSLDCDDENPCTDDGCMEDVGCVHVPNSNPCQDGNTCTEGDHCGAGVCTTTDLLDCNDGDPCHTGECDPVGGCVLVEDIVDCDGVIQNDNCPEVYNPAQEDGDWDGFGDACDSELNCSTICVYVDSNPNLSDFPVSPDWHDRAIAKSDQLPVDREG